jgi:hypothetical protein
MTMTGPEVSIIASVLGVGLGIAILLMRTTARLDRRIDNDKAAADADRRAWQDSMDDFKKEMQRLAERQSRVEGRLEGAPGD